MASAGEIGPVRTLGDTHHLFQVLAREESRIPPLADVRAQVLVLAARDRRIAAARAALQRAVSDSKTAAELEANAKKAGISTEATDWFAPLADRSPGNWPGRRTPGRTLPSFPPRRRCPSKIYPGGGGRLLAVAFLEERPAGDADWAGRKEAHSSAECGNRKKAP